MFKLILIFICIHTGYSYLHGAPTSACTSMLPNHDAAPLQCQRKYIIESDKSYYGENEVVRVTVRGATYHDYFKGIILVAVTEYSQEILGTWSVLDSFIKTISCNNTYHSAVTHSSGDNKLKIEAVWYAPSIKTKENIIIKATIVQTYREIYADCFRITLKRREIHALDGSLTVSQSARAISSLPNTNVTWSYANNKVTAKMMTNNVNLGEWRSIGFSVDDQMGDEYIFVCQVSLTGDATLRRMHTKPGKRPPLNSVQNVTINQVKYENGYITCEFSFDTNSLQSENESEPIVIQKDYYILFAAGVLRSPEQLAKHNLTVVTSRTYQLQSPATINFNDRPTTTISPTNSTNNALLTTVTTTSTATTQATQSIGLDINWTYDNGLTSVKMVVHNLQRSQWSALGLSHDEFMGEDHVFICRRLADDTVSIERFVNPKGHSRPVLASTTANVGGTFNVTRQSLGNGVAYCEFTLSNFVSPPRQSHQNRILELSQTNSYHPLIAFGSMDVSNIILKHSQSSRTALSQIVLLNRTEKIAYNVKSIESSYILMKAHGIVMVFTWIVLVSTAILLARHFKQAWPERKICGKPIWFAVHRALMILAVLLTITAFILILVYKNGQWVSKTSLRDFAHSIAGILVICFAVIQPIMALFRCAPDAQNRYIFNFFHATVGFTAFTLSLATMLLGIFSTQFSFKSKREWSILVAWICWLFFIFIVLEFSQLHIHARRVSYDKQESVAMTDRRSRKGRHSKSKMREEEQNHSQIKNILLLLHIIVAFGLSIALMVRIGQAEL